MVGSKAAHESFAPRPEAQHFQVVRRQLVSDDVNRLFDFGGLRDGGQSKSRADALGHGGVAAVAGKDEDQRRQQPGMVKRHDHVRPGDARAHLLALLSPGSSPAAAATSALDAAPGAGEAPVGHLGEFGIDLGHPFRGIGYLVERNILGKQVD